jgi:hypothetical protein
MAWQKKAAVIFTFVLGGLACTCSMVRMAYIERWAKSNEISCTLPPKHSFRIPLTAPTGDGYLPSLWGQLEATFSIIAVSLPALRMLFARLLPGLMSAKLSGYIREDSGGGTQRTRGSAAGRFKTRGLQRKNYTLESIVEQKQGHPPVLWTYNSEVELVKVEGAAARKEHGSI